MSRSLNIADRMYPNLKQTSTNRPSAAGRTFPWFYRVLDAARLPDGTPGRVWFEVDVDAGEPSKWVLDWWDASDTGR